MKINHVKSSFQFEQEFPESTKVVLWKVIFTGVHTNLLAHIYKNNQKIAGYKCFSGHACKTKAMGLIKSEISNPSH